MVMDGIGAGENLQNDFCESSQYDEEETLISRSESIRNSGNSYHIFRAESVVEYTHVVSAQRISKDLGETSGALLNITIGNLAELIIFITALMKNNIKVVQASLLGSVLVNLLLVLGSAIIAGSIISPDQSYNNDVTQSFVVLLNLAVSSLMIPSAFYGSVKSVASADRMALAFSRGVSVILLIIYFLYLVFQFKTHPHLFRSHVPRLQDVVAQNRSSYDHLMDIESHHDPETDSINTPIHPEMQQTHASLNSTSVPIITLSEPGTPMVPIGSAEQDDADYQIWHDHNEDTQDSHRCKPMILANRIFSLSLLIASTILIAICAESFSTSFSILNEKGILGESFVGLIIIPVAGNVAENVTAVIVATKSQMDLAISVALGSAIQIGLLVAPVIVLVGWALNKPMTLHFDYFGMVTLVGSVLLVSFIILKGKTNWLEGAILCACFAAISYVLTNGVLAVLES
ncbi:Sodium/calcium exchanger membrane region [Penicillium maclennaniae]|uniref:Sodium/calcium exchanger membrane region n=1 Tax=Penicillium maclennaniae TaxID=1343394 RepID=UPI002541F2FF|nr:Sodium/calcium exchanger membrane region [Penicillium maclennaniae]KAJ5667846.1 Sodium/calcium exchanger membrane region [Penicillium maclennaniae]